PLEYVSHNFYTKQSNLPQHYASISEARNAGAISGFDWITRFKIKRLIDDFGGILEISLLPSLFFETYNLAFPVNITENELGSIMKSTYPETFEILEFENNQYISSIPFSTLNNTTSLHNVKFNSLNLDPLFYDYNFSNYSATNFEMTEELQKLHERLILSMNNTVMNSKKSTNRQPFANKLTQKYNSLNKENSIPTFSYRKPIEFLHKENVFNDQNKRKVEDVKKETSLGKLLHR
ncbi:11065_t:CDS:2, partial [Acaulospora colombiana]